jgi:hypothetical protein
MEDPLMASNIFSLWLKGILYKSSQMKITEGRRAVLQMRRLTDTPLSGSPLVRIAEIQKFTSIRLAWYR